MQRPLWEFREPSIYFQTFLQNYIEMFLKIISNEFFFLDTFMVFIKNVETILVGIFVFIESLQPHNL